MAFLFRLQALRGAYENTIQNVPAKMVGDLVCPKARVEATTIFLPFVCPDLVKRG